MLTFCALRFLTTLIILCWFVKTGKGCLCLYLPASDLLANEATVPILEVPTYIKLEFV